MKIKKILRRLAVFILLSFVVIMSVMTVRSTVSPKEEVTNPSEAENKINEQLSKQKIEQDREWTRLVTNYINEYENKDNLNNVAVGYYNTVTGEEHYLNPDKYMYLCSLYKVPLNMLELDRLDDENKGTDTLLGNESYEQLLERIIISSDNEASDILMHRLYPEDSYDAFRHDLCKYFDEDPDTLPDSFFSENKATARQMISCLKKLYEHSEGKYSPLIDCMLRAARNDFFLYHEQKAEIAHKYGQYNNETLFTNDCAIIYTTEPILLVVLSTKTEAPSVFLSDLCTLMIDYAEDNGEKLYGNH